MSDLQPALRAEGLSRSYGATTALAEVDLSLDAGQVAAVLGPNGAGKTTLLALLTGSLRPTKGTVFLHGTPIDPTNPDWRRTIGVVSHRSGLYRHLSAKENLLFFGALHGLDRAEERSDHALERVGLAPHANRAVREFSRGMAQRLAIARATLHDPQLLFFDEPFTGLDVEGAASLERRINELRDAGNGVVLVTHRTRLAATLADRLLVLVRGRVAYAGSDHPRSEGIDDFVQQHLDDARDRGTRGGVP